MNYWLLKCEPDHDYSYADLEKDGKTVWDGVSNNWALKFIREVKKGDKVLYGKYSGTEFSFEGTDYLIMRESDILAVL